jgi:hypothetical protein
MTKELHGFFLSLLDAGLVNFNMESCYGKMNNIFLYVKTRFAVFIYSLVVISLTITYQFIILTM